MFVKFNGQTHMIKNKADFEKMLWFDSLNGSELYEAYKYVTENDDDDLEYYKEESARYECLADGYRSSMVEINNLAHDMYNEFIDKKTINRKVMFEYINKIIKTANEML